MPEENADIPAYFVVNRKVIDAEAAQRYLAGAAPVTASFGGEYLVRGSVPERLEGRVPEDGYALVIIRFPNRERALAFYSSEAYRPWRDLAQQAFDRDFQLVEGYVPVPTTDGSPAAD